MGSRFCSVAAGTKRLSLDLAKAVKNVDMYPFVFVLSFIIGVVKANEPNILREFGSHLEFTDDWAQHLLKSLEGVKRKATTGKVEPSKKIFTRRKILLPA